MGLFSKLFQKKENPKNKENQIENGELKINLANTAMGMLTEGADYENLAFTEVQFGYLYMIENHGLEALYKITTDKGVFYFAAQKESLMKLDINEEMFRATTEMFLEMHS